MTILLTSLLAVFAIQPAAGDLEAYRLNRQGLELMGQYRYQAAVRRFRAAADRATVELGPREAATAMIRRNLGLAYLQAGNSAAAEQSAQLALSIFESRFGPAEPGLTPVLNVLAECYASTGRIEEAERAEERAVSIGRSAGAHYGVALHNLGALHELSGDEEGAALWYRRAIDAKTEALGPAHPHVALSKAALQRVQRRQQLAIRSQGSIHLEQASE